MKTGVAASRRRFKRSQIHPRLPEDLRKRLRAFSGGKGSSESSVIESALVSYLDDSSKLELIGRRLDRLSRAVRRAHRDVDIVADTFAVFVQVWLAQTPRIADHERAKAERTVATRFDQFRDHVAGRLTSGRSFIADLVRVAGIAEADGAGEPEAKEGE